MHVSEADLAAIAHQQVTPLHAEARLHLAVCDECNAILSALVNRDSFVAEKLRFLDHPAPTTVQALRPRRRGKRFRVTAIAAGLAVCVVGAAAALPSFALRRFFASEPAPDHSAAPAAITHSSPAPVEEASAAVTFAAGRSLDVIVSNPHPGRTLRITLVEGDKIAARAGSGVGFSLNKSRLVIDDHGAANSISLDIPRAIQDVRVRAGSLVVFTKRGAAVTSPSAADVGGTYVIVLSIVPAGAPPGGRR